MNRKKKLNDRLKKKVKKTNAKLHTPNKPRYIAKAEREAQANGVEPSKVSDELNETDESTTKSDD
jgi:hypothetical protein